MMVSNSEKQNRGLPLIRFLFCKENDREAGALSLQLHLLKKVFHSCNTMECWICYKYYTASTTARRQILSHRSVPMFLWLFPRPSSIHLRILQDPSCKASWTAFLSGPTWPCSGVFHTGRYQKLDFGTACISPSVVFLQEGAVLLSTCIKIIPH